MNRRLTSLKDQATRISLESASKSSFGPRNSFISLPPEVRHKIYRYLFCKSSEPICLVVHYQLFQPLYSLPASRPDSIFETQLFRCCKDLYKDTISFAYRSNSFELRGDLKAFCGLSRLALSSIRTLTIVQGPWKAGIQEDKTWSLIQNDCRGLHSLDIVLQQDTFLATVACLDSFPHVALTDFQRPSLALDVYLWDRHFSFDPLYRDLVWSQDVIQNSAKHAGSASITRQRVAGLPRQAAHIVLTADITAGAVEALDSHFASLGTQAFAKSSRELPTQGPRAVGGRSTRFWYESI